MNRSKSIFSLILVIAVTVLLVITTVMGWGENNSGSARNINLGLDLEGGVSITYQVLGETPSREDMADTVYRLQLRVQDFSNESSVFQEGDDRINIEIPGVSDANLILQELGRPGSLLFIRQTDDSGNQNYHFDGEGNAVLARTVEELQETGDIILTGTEVSTASAGSVQDNLGNTEFAVSLTFTAEGTQMFADATTRAFAAGETIAIYYDGEIISAPNVNVPITNGEAQISGNFTFDEAERLASTIRIGGLSLELEELRSNVVGAQLGEEAINTSLLAGLIGLIAIIIFMCIVFLLPGFAASIALVIYTTLTLILINAFDITITLPGIAGIILGIGMAVDANIIIFARVKEELATGVSVRLALKNGFKKAMSAIIDGEVTTFFIALILWWRGSGTVRSFAQTLSLSIVVSMFTALLVTRLLVYLLYGVGLKNPKLYARKVKPRKVIDFVGHRVKYLIISGVIIIAAFVTMGINSARGEGAMNYSLEFMGGSSTHVTFNENFTLSEVDGEIAPQISAVIGNEPVQFQMVEGSTEIIFRTATLDLYQREAIANLMLTEFDVGEELIATENISSTISAEMQADAVWAIILAAIFMLAYIWIRFRDVRFAGSAVLSLFNDVLFVLAFYVFTRISVGNTFIAAMLTIFAYSVNSTIVIFDRIREELKTKGKNPDFKEIANYCVTLTLTRTIYTTISTLVTITALYVLGVTAIRPFALPLMFGIGIGVYTSVCIAASLWYTMKTKFVSKAKA
ncbi:MAG: protein translocase subunit SecD [Lachnospiraceae bacterium]|nr:protein translocase subunit SecD [Lachnospiraceae bacterium]